MTEQRAPLKPAAWLAALTLVVSLAGEGRGQAVSTTSPAPALPANLLPPGAGQPLGLSELLRLGLEQNPSLRQAGLGIAAAQGRALQAGLYPNPTVSLVGEEVGKNGGIHTLPQVTQEIVTAGKLKLGRAVAEREVDQAHLTVMRQRYVLFTAVRQGYFEVLATQRRIEVLEELAKLAAQTYENAQKLHKAQQIAELDLLQFQIDLTRLRTDLEAARREQAAARRRLAASVGVPDLPPAPLAGSIEVPLPAYDFDQARAAMLEAHPEVRSAQVGITRAQLALRREEALAVPNVTVGAGYTRNFNDREHQAMYQFSVPVPLFNRNQGNILAAKAELGRAAQEVAQVQNDLSNRLAAAHGRYAAALQRVGPYRATVLPAAGRAYRLSLEAFQGGQFEYLRVIQAQRAVAEANLEYVRALADTWQAASEIAGLLLEEEHWPACAVPLQGPLSSGTP